MSCKECNKGNPDSVPAQSGGTDRLVPSVQRPLRTGTRVCRRRSIVGAGLCCAWVIAAATAQGASLRTWRTAIVVDDQIRVGDLCELQGFDVDAYDQVKEVVVAPAPSPGGSKFVHLGELRDALARSGVNLATVLIKGASRCGVSRPAGVSQAAMPVAQKDATEDDVDADPSGERTLREAVECYFQDQMNRFGGTAHVQFGRTSQQVLDLSAPEFEFVVQRRSGRVLGLVNIDVHVQRDGTLVQTVPMVVNASYTKPVVVARRSINAKAAIRPNDVQMIDVTLSQMDRSGLSDPGEAIGQRAKRFIAAGEIIAARNLERVPLVHRGQIVDVHTNVGGVKIVTAAKAMESGGFGDAIELRATGHKRSTITGVVTGPRRVEVGATTSKHAIRETRLAAGGGS